MGGDPVRIPAQTGSAIVQVLPPSIPGVQVASDQGPLPSYQNLNSPSVGNTGSDPEDESEFDDLLRGCPAPDQHKPLSLLFSLLFGLVLPRRDVYWANMALTLLVVVGYCAWHYIAAANNYGQGSSTVISTASPPSDIRKIRLGLLMQWISKDLGLAIYAWTFIYVAVCAHFPDSCSRFSDCFGKPSRHSRRAALECLDPDCTSFHRSMLSDSVSASDEDGTVGRERPKVGAPGKVRRGLDLLRRHIPNLMALVGVIGPVLLGLDTFLIHPPRSHTFSHTSESWVVLFYLSELWGLAACTSMVALFFSSSEDLVRVIRHVRAGLNRFQTSDTGSDEQLKPAFNAMVKIRRLQCYIETSQRDQVIWLCVYIVLVVLALLCVLASEMLFILSHTNEMRYYNIGRDWLYALLTMTGLFLGFLVPVIAAARVTQAWKSMIGDLRTSLDWAEHAPRSHHYLIGFLGKFRGGFKMCGMRVVVNNTMRNLAGLLVAVSGLIRFV